MKPIEIKLRDKIRYQLRKYDYIEPIAWKILRHRVIRGIKNQESVITRLLIKNFKKL